MQEAAPARKVIKFGVFEVDPHAQELRKSGLRIKLQDQPFHVLSVLLERPGELVTRDELRQRLWPDGTFVDFEHSLNTAVKKLREALGDDADHPRFIETLHRKGYRFVAPIGNPAQSIANLVPAARSEAHPAAGKWRSALFMTVAAVLVVLAVVLVRSVRHQPTPTILASRALTSNAKVLSPTYWLMHFPGLFTDGSRIYFSTYDGAFGVSQVSVAGGEVTRVALPVRGVLLHVSSDGSKLLVKELEDAGQQEGPLWEAPSTGGKPVRVGEIVAHDAAWSPDRRSLAFASGAQISIAREDGASPNTVMKVEGLAYWLRWSPDGRRLRYTLVDPNLGTSIWEMDVASAKVNRLLSQWNGKTQLCCGEWNRNGRYFAFIARDPNHSQIVLRKETAGFRERAEKPVGLAAGPLDYQAASFAADGKTLFAVSSSVKGALARFDLKSHKLQPFLGGLEGRHVDYSRDDKWIAYSGPSPNDENIWRARADGSDTIQLTRQPLFAIFPRWSPDGKQIVFVGKLGQGPYKLYVIPRDGGTPRQLIDDQRNEIDPDWSPDGRKILFGRPPDILAEPGMKKAIHLLDVKTGQISTLPGSEGLYSPHWSRDGRYVAALTVSLPEHPMLYDTRTEKWRPLPTNGNEFSWAHDSKSIFAAEYSVEYESAKVPVYRIWLNGTVDHIMDLDKIAQVNVLGCSCCLSVTPDNSPLLNCRSGTSNLYVLDLDLP